MSDFDKVLEQTKTKNGLELTAYIQKNKEALEQSQVALKSTQDELAACKAELETAKKERSKIKGQTTKAENKATSLQKEKTLLEKELVEEKRAKEDLMMELNNQAKEIAQLKDKIHQDKKNLPSLSQLKDKAKIVMKQEGVHKVFISLTAQVFLDENKIKNAFGTKYKVAILVDEDSVQLSNP
ncbi:hypothetical protein [Aureispira sp. CCB-QB1]|uniref:hypothetical protein n=1 Tax=Aureispira sp. CCB-QB1 TaxID=1313421 RepID=UPI0006967407|nr:hypothetical protein [Aureispira sp. CCB-QB1]